MTTLNGTFRVASWDEKAYDERDGRRLTRASVSQHFEGGIAGDGAAEWLMVYRQDGGARFVGFQLVDGEVVGRRGTFVLETSGEFDGRIARWTASVVAGSQTGDLLDLSGRGIAWAPGVADRVGAAAVSATGRGGQAPAAIVALHQFASGGTIEQLRHVLGLTHSAAVRLVDSLVADGHVARVQDGGDRRSVALTLTPRGRAAARRIITARREAIRATVAKLSEKDRRALTGLAERLTANLAELRLDERAQGKPPAGGWLCRLCDFAACGRPEGRCPAAQTRTRRACSAA